MSESPRMLQGAAVAWDTSFCVSLKEYAPLANGKQQKLKTIAGIVRSPPHPFFNPVVMNRQGHNSTHSSKPGESSLESIANCHLKRFQRRGLPSLNSSSVVSCGSCSFPNPPWENRLLSQQWAFSEQGFLVPCQNTILKVLHFHLVGLVYPVDRKFGTTEFCDTFFTAVKTGSHHPTISFASLSFCICCFQDCTGLQLQVLAEVIKRSAEVRLLLKNTEVI